MQVLMRFTKCVELKNKAPYLCVYVVHLEKTINSVVYFDMMIIVLLSTEE